MEFQYTIYTLYRILDSKLWIFNGKMKYFSINLNFVLYLQLLFTYQEYYFTS